MPANHASGSLESETLDRLDRIETRLDLLVDRMDADGPRVLPDESITRRLTSSERADDAPE